jgi:hypothetical protein
MKSVGFYLDFSFIVGNWTGTSQGKEQEKKKEVKNAVTNRGVKYAHIRILAVSFSSIVLM